MTESLNIFNGLRNKTSFAMFPESYFYNKRPGKKKKKKEESKNTLKIRINLQPEPTLAINCSESVVVVA